MLHGTSDETMENINIVVQSLIGWITTPLKDTHEKGNWWLKKGYVVIEGGGSENHPSEGQIDKHYVRSNELLDKE